MTSHRVTLIEPEDGVSMRCPSLKGCYSRGRTREAKLEWQATDADEAKFFKVNEAEVV